LLHEGIHLQGAALVSQGQAPYRNFLNFTTGTPGLTAQFFTRSASPEILTA